MHKNYFDIVMAHIEENVTKSTEEIKRDIAQLIGYNSRAFGEYFRLLTGYSLDYYIRQRRLYYAAIDLAIHREKSICDIALEYQFSDQSSFARAIKDKYHVTPGEIRKEALITSESRFYFADFSSQKAGSEVAKLLRNFEIGGPTGYQLDLMEAIEHLNDEYGFDIDICYQIADLAERLDIPMNILGERCFDAVAEVRSDPHYGAYDIPPEVEFMLNAGVGSTEELDAMCKHFECEYYELDEMKIYAYRKLMKQK